MKQLQAEKKLKTRISDIAAFYHQNSRMPSFSEIGAMFRLSSKSSVHKVVEKLVAAGVVTKDSKGRLIPGTIKSSVRMLGTVEAGFPGPAEEELADPIFLDDFLIKNRESTFMLTISGESMSGAGILPGDMVIADKKQTPKNGDIVIAEIDGAWTMKYLKKEGGSVTLLPANPRFQPISPKNELKIAGVVTAVIRKYR